MNIALRNLIEGPGQTRGFLADRLVRLRKMPECNPLDFASIHNCLLTVGGYGGHDIVMVQSALSLLLQDDQQHLLLRARHTISPEAA